MCGCGFVGNDYERYKLYNFCLISMDPITIFKAVSITQAIAAYFGLIESTSNDVKKLLHQSLGSAIHNLECARNSQGVLQADYVKQAQDEFIRAIQVEKNESLISAYVGLAMCQYHRNDKYNASESLIQAKQVTLSITEIVKYTALSTIGPGDLYNIYRICRGKRDMLTQRIYDFNSFKNKVDALSLQ